jgi:predicted transcriptional regulator
MKVILKGWPATVFLTLDTRYMEELATRSFTATPEGNDLKFKEANILTNEKVSLPWKYEKETEAFTIIKRLIQSLQRNTLESKIDIVIPFLNLYELFPKEISRDMRDFQHFTQFLKTITLLHFYQRPYMKFEETRFLISTVEDVHRGFEVYNEIFETTRTGTEKRILDFYHSTVKTKETWYLKELTGAYNAKCKKKLSEESIRVMLDRLDKIGYVNTQKDDLDKRKNLYVPLMKGEEKDKNPLEKDSWQDSKAELEKGFETWKTNILGNPAFYINKKIADKEGAETEIRFEELYRHIFSSNAEPNSLRIIYNEDSKPKAETKPETNQKAETSPNLDIDKLGDSK